MSAPPLLLGKYELQEKLELRRNESTSNIGGKVRLPRTEVWKALNTQSRRTVAIRLFYADIQTDSSFVARFEREVQVIASLNHPNIVQMHDYAIPHSPQVDGPLAYIIMDYVEGQTLDEFIRRTSAKGKFSSAALIVHLFASISSAVDYAHAKGVIHGAITPANILLDFRSPTLLMPVLADFGITQILGFTADPVSNSWRGDPLYISPEQAHGSSGDPRSDLYSLGVILYEVCTGVPPFQDKDASTIMMQHMNTIPPSPVLINPGIPPALEAVILKSINKNPAARFTSASSMATALAEAFKLPVPDHLIPPDLPKDIADMPTYLTSPSPGLTPDMAPSSTSPAITSGSEKVIPTPSNGSAATKSPAPSSQNVSSSETSQSARPKSLPENPPLHKTVDVATVALPVSPKRRRKGLFITLVIVMLVGLVLSTLFLLLFNKSNAPTVMKPILGHAFFVSSGLSTGNSAQGINDMLQIDLQNLPDPAPGKNYYAWLLSDTKASQRETLFLGSLPISKRIVHYLYPGDKQQSNLLEHYSQLLITEEDTSPPPAAPSTNISVWRYYAVLPQAPNPKDPAHLGLLDHLRALLSSDSTLDALGLHSGLGIQLLQNAEKIMEWAGAARDDWQQKNTSTMSQQFGRILDYLDGTSQVADSHKVALLDSGTQASANYLSLISSHLKSILNSPGVTVDQRKSIEQINTAINNVRGWLNQIHKDAMQLAAIDSVQLLTPGTLSILDDMASQTLYAYVGQLDPATNTVENGVVQIYHTLESMAHFDITSYK